MLNTKAGTVFVGSTISAFWVSSLRLTPRTLGLVARVATGSAYAAVPPVPAAHEAREYVNVLLEAVLTGKIPLRPEGAAPLMRTGCPACRPTVALTVTVTTLGVPEVQLMLVIEFTVWRPKSTMESDPAPPG